MNFMPLTRKGGCKVTIFLRDNTHIGKQIASVLMIINQNRVKSNYQYKKFPTSYSLINKWVKA